MQRRRAIVDRASGGRAAGGWQATAGQAPAPRRPGGRMRAADRPAGSPERARDSRPVPAIRRRPERSARPLANAGRSQVRRARGGRTSGRHGSGLNTRLECTAAACRALLPPAPRPAGHDTRWRRCRIASSAAPARRAASASTRSARGRVQGCCRARPASQGSLRPAGSRFGRPRPAGQGGLIAVDRQGSAPFRPCAAALARGSGLRRSAGGRPPTGRRAASTGHPAGTTTRAGRRGQACPPRSARPPSPTPRLAKAPSGCAQRRRSLPST